MGHPGSCTPQYTNSSIEKAALKLGASAIFPLTSLTFMLLAWHQGDREECILSEPDTDEAEPDNEEPAVRYITEEEYQSYAPHPTADLTHH